MGAMNRRVIGIGRPRRTALMPTYASCSCQAAARPSRPPMADLDSYHRPNPQVVLSPIHTMIAANARYIAAVAPSPMTFLSHRAR